MASTLNSSNLMQGGGTGISPPVAFQFKLKRIYDPLLHWPQQKKEGAVGMSREVLNPSIGPHTHSAQSQFSLCFGGSHPGPGMGSICWDWTLHHPGFCHVGIASGYMNVEVFQLLADINELPGAQIFLKDKTVGRWCLSSYIAWHFLLYSHEPSPDVPPSYCALRVSGTFECLLGECVNWFSHLASKFVSTHYVLTSRVILYRQFGLSWGCTIS